MMEARVEEFIQQPDAPTFYWPLTDLPQPFIDLRKPMQGDRVMVYGAFPGMAEMAADLNAKPFSPDQVKVLVTAIAGFNAFYIPLDAGGMKALTLRLAARHEAAKKVLIDQGRPKELVDAMPHIQVGVMVALMQYDELFDDLLKWEELPFWQARAGVEMAEAQQKEVLDGKEGPAIPLAKSLLPAASKVLAARTRLDRRIAATRCVEAAPASTPPPTTANCRRPWTRSRTYPCRSTRRPASRLATASLAIAPFSDASLSPVSRPATSTRRHMKSV